MKYSDKVVEHFTNPRNVGVVEDANGVGRLGNPVCGDMMEMSVKVVDNVIADVKFRTFGCGAAIATSSMATELIKGKTIEEALELSNQAIAEALDGLPPIKMHCSVLAADALKLALADYYRRQGQEEKAKDLVGEEVSEVSPEACETEQAEPLRWSNPEAIAQALARGYPQLKPMEISIPALFRRILSLPGFGDDPDQATESLLEKIQLLWHDEVSE